MKYDFDEEKLLSLFVKKEKDESHPFLMAPYECNGYVYATDSLIAIKINPYA